MFLSARAAAAVLAAGVGAVVIPGPDVLLFAVGLLAVGALVAWDVARAPGAEDLGVRRFAPSVGRTGREDRVSVRVRNPRSRPVRLSLRDAAPPSLHRAPRIHAATLAAASAARLDGRIRPERRGRLPLGPITVRASGPLALAGRQGTLAEPWTVKVYPPLPARREVALRLERARLLQSGERSTAVRGGGSDFDSLREYHPDDEFRRINWRATARTTRTISNVYREERNQQVMLLFDCGRTMATSLRDVSRFELALDAGFAVAELAARVGDQVGMLAFSAGVVSRIAPRGGRSQPRRILDQLYDVEPTLDAPNYRLAFAQLLDRHRRRALLILLTELTHPAAMEGLLDALPALRARHVVIVATVRDPAVEAMARATPASSEAAYAKAAAAEFLAQRDAAAARLRRLGAVVVDRPPGALGGALADQYLRIKAHGRL